MSITALIAPAIPVGRVSTPTIAFLGPVFEPYRGGKYAFPTIRIQHIPEASMAPPWASGHARVLFRGTYGPRIVFEDAAPTQ
jgi:hypothetical protein